MEVQIISEESIKPSSSTPPHLKTFKISLLDQFMVPMFYSTALFYPNTAKADTSQRSLVLRHSLSQTLTHFYPLAGKIRDHFSIDCNDDGALYIQAKANVSMAEYLTLPDLTLLPKFVPKIPPSFLQNPAGASVAMVQETTFPCGGFAVGLTVSHMVLDGTALASFIKSWSAAAAAAAAGGGWRKTNANTDLNLDSPSVFPQCDAFPEEALFSSLWSPFLKKEKVVAKRLLFHASAIDKLKATASSGKSQNPTRAEVVSALISKTVMAALNAKAIVVNHAVNIRRKATPPFPDSSLGNFVWVAPAIVKEKEGQLSEVVYKIRKAIRKVDSEFVKKITPLKLFKELKEIENGELCKGEELVLFTSWCNFGMYNGSDFGWGKTIWIAHCTIIDSEEMAFNCVSILNDTRSGNGVEAWIYLPQDIALALDKDDELLQYASINSSPLLITNFSNESGL